MSKMKMKLPLWVALYTMVEGSEGPKLKEMSARAPCERWTIDEKTGVMRNRETVGFPAAATDWGEIVAFALWTAPRGGRQFAEGPLDRAMRVSRSCTALFDPGDIAIKVDPSEVI